MLMLSGHVADASAAACSAGGASQTSHDNHVIIWLATPVLDRESDKSTRWIKETVTYSERGMTILELE